MKNTIRSIDGNGDLAGVELTDDEALQLELGRSVAFEGAVRTHSWPNDPHPWPSTTDPPGGRRPQDCWRSLCDPPEDACRRARARRPG
jgi:hypothetical protein